MSIHKVHVVLGEWKYTENYTKDKCIQVSSSGTDRLDRIYRPFLESPDCQINLGPLPPESLFFDPFDQLMRQQLLATEMEKAHEMSADVVSLLHIAPEANKELMKRITSKALREVGDSVHTVWESLVPKRSLPKR